MSKRWVIAMIALVLCSLSVKAQWPVDSAKRETLAKIRTQYKDALFVEDGAVIDIDAKWKSLTPDYVFDIIVLPKEQNKNLTWTSRDAVVITSKAAAISYYKRTLSKLSSDYKNYLDENNNDDSSLRYILNSQPLKSGSEEQLDRLYKLSPEKITNVSLTTVNGKKTLIIDINFDE